MPHSNGNAKKHWNDLDPTGTYYYNMGRIELKWLIHPQTGLRVLVLTEARICDLVEEIIAAGGEPRLSLEIRHIVNPARTRTMERNLYKSMGVDVDEERTQ